MARRPLTSPQRLRDALTVSEPPEGHDYRLELLGATAKDLRRIVGLLSARGIPTVISERKAGGTR